MVREIHKAVCVWAQDNKTCYFQNPSGAWELPSQQHEPRFLDDPEKTRRILLVIQQLSNEKFYGTQIRLLEHICDGSGNQTSSEAKIYFKFYRVEFEKTPILNRAFYTNLSWMTQEELLSANIGKLTGIETNVWLEKISKNT